MNRPLILGHRGASAFAPDNTLQAFRLAVAHGADGVELDVRFTADQVVVINHDPDVGEIGPLIHHEFDAIRQARPEVPTLDEVLMVLADLIINVEIKNSPLEPDFDPSHEMAKTVAAWVGRHAIHERVVVTSFNPETVSAVRTADAMITTGQLIGPGLDLDRQLAPIAAAGHQWIAPNIADVAADAPAVISTAHSAGLKVAVWTADDPADIRTVTAAGVDAIISNDPLATLQIVAEGSAP